MDRKELEALEQLKNVAEGFLDPDKSSYLLWSRFSLELSYLQNEIERRFHEQVMEKAQRKRDTDF